MARNLLTVGRGGSIAPVLERVDSVKVAKMVRILVFLAAIFGVLIAAPVGATQWLSSYTTQGTYQVAANTGQYSSVNTGSIGGSSLFTNILQLALYSGGFGTGNQLAGGSYEGGSLTKYAGGTVAVAVVQFPAEGRDADAVRLGWPDSSGSGSGAQGAPELSVFFGSQNPNGNYDFTYACFSGCANTTQGTTNDSSSSTTNNLVVYTGSIPSLSGGGSGVDTGGSGGPRGKAPRYLLVAGVLGGDNWKVDMLSPGFRTSQVVASPGTVALLGIGLFGLAALVRRRAILGS